MLHRGHTQRALVMLAAAPVLGTVLVTLNPPSANALEAPSGLTLNIGQSGTVVTWDRLGGASSYLVQIDDNSDFSSTLVNQATTNHVFVPTAQLPTGVVLHARVQAKQGSAGGDWSPSVTAQQARLSAPAHAQPPDGSTFSSGVAPVFAWDAISGTTNYQVRIATANSSECEGSLLKTWTSESSEFVVRDRVLAPGQPYYWCVRGALPDNVFSEWTAPHLVQIADLGAPALVSPANGAEVHAEVDGDAREVVGDTDLDWDPVAGAARYRLQVGWDQNFSTGIRVDTTLTATRWSPNPKALDNRTWYWRVQAIDASGNPHAWSTFRYFTRVWRSQPTLEWPADGTSVPASDMYYEWSAVSRAEYYTVQTAWDADFTSHLASCTSNNTTLVGECGGNPNGYTYWRVLANEDHTLGINDSGRPYEHTTQTEVGAATVWRYRSTITRPAKLSPANGDILASGAVPTLTWAPVTFAATYVVTITNAMTGAAASGGATTATSFTPRSVLAPGTYRWDVVPQMIDGATINNLELPEQATFTVSGYVASGAVSAAAAPALLTDGATGYRSPTLAWEPVDTATKYAVKVKPHTDTSWRQLSETFAYPAAQNRGITADDATFLAPGSYDWKVQPYDGNVPLAESPVGSFAIMAPYDPVAGSATTYASWLASTNLQAALSGNAMYGNNGEAPDDEKAYRCHLTTDTTGCANLRQTPILRWQPKAGATENPNIAFYKLSLYADQARTTPVPGYQNLIVRRHAWMPGRVLADAQAGQEGSTSAYWVRLIPCTYAGCATSASTDPTINDPLANAFNKSYDRAVTTAPTATVTTSDSPGDNDLVFRWQDMLDAETTASASGTSLTGGHADTEAVSYQLQWGRLQNLSDATTVTVDHTFYTPPDVVGDGDVYWRVRALDSDGNPFNWSQTADAMPAHFTVASPKPRGLTPAGASSQVGSRQTLSWSPAPYASKYVVEIYAGEAPQGSSTTDRKVNDTVFTTSWTPSTLLAAGLDTWRVRGIDANGNLMTWSDWAHVTVTPTAPTQVLAPENSEIAPQSLFLSWTDVDGATSYKVEWRLKGSTGLSSQTTAALAWAPTTALAAAGDWEWRVTAMRGNVAWGSPTEWRPFHVTLSPTATTPPSIPRTGVVEDTLTVTPPVWDRGDNGQTTYQWYRGSAPVAGAVGPTYVLTGADAAAAIKVVATLTVPGYLSGSSTSNVATVTAAPAPVALRAPVIGGDPHPDGMLQVTAEAAWSNGASTTYQWLRDGNLISGRTGLTYVVQGADVGHSISARATGRLVGYADGLVVSNAVSTLGGAAATLSISPVITGGTPVGSTLSLSTQPTWIRNGSPVTANCTTYQWLRDGEPIYRATKSTYKTADADGNLPIAVSVTCAQTGYDASAPVLSNAIVPVLGSAPTPLVAPALAGTAAPGLRLTVTPGVWSPTATSVGYQWRRDGRPIPRATKTTYTVTMADIGHLLSAVVTAKVSGHASAQHSTRAVRVPKVGSTTTARLVTKKVKKSKHGALSVTVTTAAPRSGTVQVLDGSRVIVAKRLPPAGRLRIKLPKLKKGVHRLKVHYLGNASVNSSATRALKLVVTT